MTHWNYWA